MIVSAPNGPADDDAYWRRPEHGDATGFGPQRPAPEQPPAVPPYSGPPQVAPPPPQWQPPVVAQPPPPRSLPGQDLAVLEEAEGSARTLTYGIGMVAAAILIVIICLLCSRLLF